MTAAAPALTVLCPCGHAARLHGDDGCLKVSCGCSRDRDEAAAQSASTPAPATPAEQPAEPMTDPASDSTSPEPAAAPDPAPAPDPSTGAGAGTTGDDDEAAEPNFVEVAQALKAGRDHADPKIKALATRIDGELLALADLLADWDHQADGRAKVARLEAELAEARIALMGDDAPVCPDCKKPFSTKQAVGVHRARIHGYRRGDDA